MSEVAKNGGSVPPEVAKNFRSIFLKKIRTAEVKNIQRISLTPKCEQYGDEALTYR